MGDKASSDAAVTDEMLDSAAAETDAEDNNLNDFEDSTAGDTGDELGQGADGEKTDEEDDKDIPDEPEDNSERSKLGRKVAALFNKQDRLETTLEKLTELLEKTQSGLYKNDNTDADADEDEDIILTKDQLESYLAQREAKRQSEAKEYESGYIQKVSELGLDLDPQEHEAIVDEMMRNFNVRYSSDPAADAERNYLKAERAVLRKKMASQKKNNPLKGEKSRSPLGVANNQSVEKKSPPLPDLDDEAKEFLAYIRKTSGDEEAEKYHKSLTGEIPSYIAAK